MLPLIVEHLLGLGFLFMGLACLVSYDTNVVRFRLPFVTRDLEAMRTRWGFLPGTILHVLSYVIAPFGFGMLFLMGMVF